MVNYLIVSGAPIGQMLSIDCPDVHELEIVYPWWNLRETVRREEVTHELASVYPWWAAAA